jgi:hypothetical protein
MSRDFKISIGAIAVAALVYFVPWARLTALRPFATVTHAGIQGAIVPSRVFKSWQRQKMLGGEVEGLWTPQQKDTELAEDRLRPDLERLATDSPEVQQILEHYNEYRRQYVGLVIHGRRHIYLNSFPRDTVSDYTKQFIMVMDGAFGFWQILYSVDDGTFLNLSINYEG